MGFGGGLGTEDLEEGTLLTGRGRESQADLLRSRAVALQAWARMATLFSIQKSREMDGRCGFQ